MKDTKKNLFFKIVFTGIMIALMFALSFTVLGMIPMVFASATTVFIPVAIGIICLDDFRFTAVLGLGFGLSSFTRALIAPQGVLDPFFANPIVSILPRVLASLLCHLIFRLTSKVIKNRYVNAGIGGGVMAFCNTLFTIPFLILCYYKEIGDILVGLNMSYGYFIGTGIILTSMLPEIVVGAIISIIVYIALYKAFLKKEDEVIETEDTEKVEEEESVKEVSNDPQE